MRKFLFLATILTLLGSIVQAQNLPDWTWAKSISASNGIQVQDLLMDNEGNMYVSGTAFRGPISMDGSVFSADSNQNIFLAKFNSTGSLLWKATVVNSDVQFMGSINPESIMLDNANNIYLTIGAMGMGSGSDTVHLTLNCNVQKDFGLIGKGYMELPMKTLIKLDENGNLDYIAGFEGYSQGLNKGKPTAKGKTKGNTMGLNINDKKVDNTGNLFIAGTFRADSLKLGNFNIKGNSLFPTSFITKIDTAGRFSWATIDSSSQPSYSGGEALSLIIDAAGNPLIFGDFGTVDRKYGNFTITNHDNYSTNLYFVSIDNKDGTPLSLVQYGGDSINLAGALYTDSKGNHYITGVTCSSSLFGLAASGTHMTQTFLANIDESANIIWARILNTELTNPFSPNQMKLVFTPQDYPVLSGLFTAKTLSIDALSANIHDTATMPYTTDFFAVKFDPVSQEAINLTSFGTQMSDYDYNIFCDKHNITTLIIPVNDTIIYLASDTVSCSPPASGFLIAYLDSSFKLVGKKSFVPTTGQNMSIVSKNVSQSYSGYVGVAGGYYGKTLYLGNTTISTLDTNSYNMFVAKMGYTINGTVHDVSGINVNSGYVKLYVLGENGPAILVDSVFISVDNGSYHFTDAPLSGSLLYAIPDTNVYQYYAGTYAGNSMLWTGAAVLDLLTTNPATFDITFKQVLPTTGIGTITGTVTETLVKSEQVSLKLAGRPMKGASVVLVGKSTKGTDTIVAITQTDDLGFYQFNKIPVGDYKVWIDVTGLGMKEYYAVSLTDVAPAVSNVDYIVSETGIYKDLSSGIKITKRMDGGILLYPSPAINSITVTTAEQNTKITGLKIFSLNGALVKSVLVSTVNGSVTMNVSGLSPGMYIMKAEFEGKVPIYSRFVKE